MLRNIILLFAFFFVNVNFLQARNAPQEVLFGEWLVSCVYSEVDDSNDCFMGTQFEDDEGYGAIIFTNYYLAITHDVADLSSGISLKIDQDAEVASNMNTSVNVFFKSQDRMRLLLRMLSGKDLYINMAGQKPIKKSLAGFTKAYNYYLVQY